MFVFIKKKYRPLLWSNQKVLLQLALGVPLCSEAQLTLEKKLKAPSKRNQKLSCAIQENLRLSESSAKELASKLSKRKDIFVFRPEIAEKLVSSIMTHRTNPAAPVLDVRAGPGLVCKEFLSREVSKVVALEIMQGFFPTLMELEEAWGSRFSFFNWNMTNWYLRKYVSASNKQAQKYNKLEEQVAESLVVEPSLPACSDVPYSLVYIGTKEGNNFLLPFLLQQLPCGDLILSRGRVELFLIVNPTFKFKMDHVASLNSFNLSNLPFQLERSSFLRFSFIHASLHLFYDIQFIDQFNLDDFYPIFNTVKQSKALDKLVDSSKRLLVKVQLKKDIGEILPLEHHIPFISFLYQVYRKKAVRTIPTMEMLVPGCGLRMVAEGFTLMDLISFTSPEQCLHLYKVMLSWPEYNGSPLQNHLAKKTFGIPLSEDSLEEESGEFHDVKNNS